MPDNIQTAIDNRTIIRRNCYELAGNTIHFRHTLEEHQSVEVITPSYIASVLYLSGQTQKGKEPQIIVTATDSFGPDTDLVMNFANGYNPGGGYLHGAPAQEESLCRESTLYASISSKPARIMYESNRRSENPFNTDYMLISPCVEVFRDDRNRLLPSPKTTAVLTVAAPNLRYDPKMRGVSQKEVDRYMMRRIRQILAVCAGKGYSSLTLGAWGCGAFGHDAGKVAGYFDRVLFEEGMAGYFRKIVFAVKGERTYNYRAFEKQFAAVRYGTETH